MKNWFSIPRIKFSVPRIKPHDVYTVDTYLSLPLEQRETPRLKLYMEPRGYLLHSDDGDFFSECDKFESFFKKNYPIQHFFRSTISYCLSRLWYTTRDRLHRINYFFNPRQKWLVKQIPKDWCDKVELIPNIMFACLIHFVEEEDGLDSRSWEYSEGVKKDLSDAYRYVKEIRDRLEKLTWSAPYSRHRFYESLYEKLESKYLNIIVAHRAYLWT